jgi:hypothetical protein
MRRTAMLLAILVVLVDVTLHVVDEVRLSDDVGSVFELGVVAWLSRSIVTVAFVLPWLVGALLLQRRRRALGAAVLVPAAVLLVPSVLILVRRGIDLAGGASASVWVDLVGSAATWTLAIAAGSFAWLARPRGGLRDGAPGRGNAYVVLAFLAWLPTILASTQFVPPGAEGTPEGARHFYEYLWDTTSGVGAVTGLAESLLFGGLLILGPALRRDLAGALVLVVVGPALLLEAQTLLTIAGQDFVIPTPAAVLGLVGLIGTAAIAVRWVVTGVPAGAERPGSEGSAAGADDQEERSSPP